MPIPVSRFVRPPFLLLFFLVMSALAFGGCTDGASENDDAIEWTALADSMQQDLHERYWNAADQYYLADDSADTEFHYWWSAHALDALVDAYQRTQDDVYLKRMRALHEGIRKNSEGTWQRPYYDDMAWLGLSSLRAYQATGESRYLEATRTLWGELKGGWNDRQGGGIAWRRSQPGYKNTPSNAPSVILAVRLHRELGDQEYRDWAERIYAWLNDTLVNQETGLVWDGVNRQGNGEIDRNWIFTYNQGTYIGAAHEMYRMTGEEQYLDDAVRTANYVLDSEEVSPAGVLKAEGDGDGGLFKGILVRYLTRFSQSEGLEEQQRQQYRSFLRQNARTLYHDGLQRPSLRVGSDRQAPSQGPVDLSVQLSGLMLIEMMARLE